MSFEIIIEADDIKEIARKLKGVRIDDAIEVRMRFLALFVSRRVKEEAPKKTGKLASGIMPQREEPGTWTIYETGTLVNRPGGKVNYGPIVRSGTTKKNYEIRHKLKKALWWPGLTRPVAKVTHPGFKANPYHKRAMEKSESAIAATARAIGADVVAIIAD